MSIWVTMSSIKMIFIFKSHSTRSAMASLLLSNNVPFLFVKKMGRWKSNDTVVTFYDKRIIGEKSGGFLNTGLYLIFVDNENNNEQQQPPQASLINEQQRQIKEQQQVIDKQNQLLQQHIKLINQHSQQSNNPSTPPSSPNNTTSITSATITNTIKKSLECKGAYASLNSRVHSLEVLKKADTNTRQEMNNLLKKKILQCKSRPPKPSFRDESQIVIQSNQELQLATEKRSLQSHPTSVRSNPDGSFRISPEPSNDQLLNNQKQGLPATHYFAFYPKENEFIQFEEGFYNTDLPNWRSETWYPMIQAQALTSLYMGNHRIS
ncbi:hypothetical protein ACTFIR_009415 [Dictyostelium discoideum]